MNQEDNRRCGWCKSDPLYIRYHDEEWRKEVIDDLKNIVVYKKTTGKGLSIKHTCRDFHQFCSRKAPIKLT